MSSPNFNHGVDEEEESNGNHHELSDYCQLIQGYERTHEIKVEFRLRLDSSDDQHSYSCCQEDTWSNQDCSPVRLLAETPDKDGEGEDVQDEEDY